MSDLQTLVSFTLGKITHEIDNLYSIPSLPQKSNSITQRIILHQDQISVPCFLVTPKLQENHHPAIVFVHWLETHAEDSNATQFLPMAQELAEQGFISILPECFWSVDKGKFAENPQHYTRNWWRTDVEHDLALIAKQLRELKLVEQFILNHSQVDSSRIGLAAHDFGAMFASVLSQLGVRFKVYAFMAMTAYFSDWFRFGSKLSEEELQPYIQALSFTAPLRAMPQLSPSPVYLGFANNDFYVPLAVADMIVEATNHPKQVKYYEAEHGMNSQAFEDLKFWLLEHI